MARPERFELPTARFAAEYSIQLSYGRRTERRIMLTSSIHVKRKFKQSVNIQMNEYFRLLIFIQYSAKNQSLKKRKFPCRYQESYPIPFAWIYE